MISKSDLTLLNINMPKNSTFAQYCPKRFSIKTKKGSKAKVE